VYALQKNDSCHGDDVGQNYVIKSMVAWCTDVFVAFKDGEPMGFALLDKLDPGKPDQTELLMMCASEKARGTGTALIKLVIEAAKKERRTLTLSALPHVLAYYYRLGFRFGRTHEEHVTLDGEEILENIRLKKTRDEEYDLGPIEKILVQLHKHKLQVNDKHACVEALQFADLISEKCHTDGYYMHFCPKRRGALAASPAPGPGAGAQAEGNHKHARARPPAQGAGEGAKGKHKRARSRQGAPDERRYVSKRDLRNTKEDQSAGLYWRRKTKDAVSNKWTTEEVSWAVLNAETKQRAENRRMNAQSSANLRSRRRKEAAIILRKKGEENELKCASKERVLAQDAPKNLRVCSGRREHGNYKQLDKARVKAEDKQWGGKCVSERAISRLWNDKLAEWEMDKQSNPDAPRPKLQERVCSGNAKYKNRVRYNAATALKKTNEWYEQRGKCAGIGKVRNDADAGNLRYCTRDIQTGVRVRLTKEQLKKFEEHEPYM
jgi:GNAT superfamily N-acetyltransferase